MDVIQEYRVKGEGSEQPPESPLEPDVVGEGAIGGGGDTDGTELASAQQQSCECHVCTAPLMTPVSIVFECNRCVQLWSYISVVENIPFHHINLIFDFIYIIFQFSFTFQCISWHIVNMEMLTVTSVL